MSLPDIDIVVLSLLPAERRDLIYNEEEMGEKGNILLIGKKIIIKISTVLAFFCYAFIY